jgi:DnaJ-class molecular chaperone
MQTGKPEQHSETAPLDVNPGDQAPAGSPQSGENMCPKCSGTGTLAGGSRCENCGGTGRVIELVGDA